MENCYRKLCFFSDFSKPITVYYIAVLIQYFTLTTHFQSNLTTPSKSLSHYRIFIQTQKVLSALMTKQTLFETYHLATDFVSDLVSASVYLEYKMQMSHHNSDGCGVHEVLVEYLIDIFLLLLVGGIFQEQTQRPTKSHFIVICIKDLKRDNS